MPVMFNSVENSILMFLDIFLTFDFLTILQGFIFIDLFSKFYLKVDINVYISNNICKNFCTILVINGHCKMKLEIKKNFVGEISQVQHITKLKVYFFSFMAKPTYTNYKIA